MYSVTAAVDDLLTQDSGRGLQSVHPTAAYLCTACPCCWNADAGAEDSEGCSCPQHHDAVLLGHLIYGDLG